jgi:hypothetical protein
MLEKLKDSELHSNLKTLVVEERERLHAILLHVAEVDRRKLYLHMAYPSLWEYMLALGYSEGAAQRRIKAARLIQRLPSVGKKIEEGSIKLSQVLVLEKVETKDLLKLIEKMENKSKTETEVILAQEFNLPVETAEKQRHQADESLKLELTFTKEEWERIKEVKDLLAHAIKDSDMKSLINYLVNKELKKKSTTATAIVVRQRDKCCQWKDPQTNKQCKSTYLLQVDHIQPKWAGGSNNISNLRILCAAHNRYRYQQGL